MASWLLDAIIIFCPPLTYVDQYRTIAQSGHLGSFNPWICIILILSNILRCFFWIEKPFDTALLYQSFCMTAAQLLLLELCIRIQRSKYKAISLNEPLDIHAFSPRPSQSSQVARFHFLHWMLLLFGFVLVLKALNIYLSPNSIYTEILGTLALGLEATVPMPQCYSNYKNKSTSGVSLLLIFSWFVGDFSKILYYLWIASPFQFVACGLIQLSVDIIIFIQLKLYSSPRPTSPLQYRAHSI